MAFYIVYFLSCFVSFFGDLNRKSRITIFLAIVLVLVLFAGTRLDIDNDYKMYYDYFAVPDKSITDFLNRTVSVEWCIYIIPHAWMFIFNRGIDIAYASFLTFAFFGVLTKMTAIKRIAKFFFLSTILYVSNLFIMQEMTTIRAGVASGIFLLSIKDLELKNNKIALFKYLISFIFHNSSILFVFSWLIIKINLNIKYYYYAIFISFIIAVFKINLLKMFFLDRIFSRVAIYIDAMEVYGDKGGTNIFNFRIIIALFFVMFFAYFYNKLKNVKYFENLFRIHIFSLCLFFLLSSSAQVFSLRGFELLSVIQILLYPMIIYVFPPKSKFIGWTIIIVISLFQIYYLIDIADIYKPYQSWFF